jgi:hypothetical protein
VQVIQRSAQRQHAAGAIDDQVALDLQAHRIDEDGPALRVARPGW